MGLPMSYVRKKPKGYGRNARIEGDMSEGQRVLLVEDLTTDGGSKLSFVDAIAIDAATGDKWFGTRGGVSRLGADGARRGHS